ncbi:MAG: DNA polymerase I [Planctomycetota bacterium]
MTSSNKKRLYLIDGTALAYRSHFALAQTALITVSGQPTGATFGFANSMRALIDKEKPDYLVVAFDTGGETQRHKSLPTYKATREKAPDEMVAQFPWIERVAEGYGARVLKQEGIEADDILATLARRAAESGFEVFLVTKDKDFAQLVNDDIKMYILPEKFSAAQIWDDKGVEDKFGVPPRLIVDYLSLVGDSSDNIPGAKGVGALTAPKLLKEFGSVEAILEAAERGKLKTPVMSKNIADSASAVKLAKTLITLNINVPDLPKIEDLRSHQIDGNALRELFKELDFNNLINTLPKEAGARTAVHENYHLVRDAEMFRKLCDQLKGTGRFAFDTETTGLDALQCEIVGISFSWRPEEAWYVPLKVDPPVLPGGAAEVLSQLKPMLEDPKIIKVGQNCKYDSLVLGERGIRVAPLGFDTLIASYCIAPGSRAHNLDALALRYFNLQKIPTSALIGTGKAQITMDLVPVEKVAEYACEDADVTFRLVEPLEKELISAGTDKLFYNLEMPLVPVLIEMERRGVKINVEMLKTFSKMLSAEQTRLENEIYELASGRFQINSTKELGVILFERMRLHEAIGRKNARKTKTGYSTDAEVLEELAAVAPIAAKVLEYRQVTKLQNTYLETLPTLVNKKTGRVHTTFRQTVAATGRLSSDNPNLQNIPIRTALGREIRRAFVPEEGNILISADYSQIELRLVAHFSGDPVLKSAFERGEDIHKRTASVVFGVMPELVTHELRSRAKAINFGIIYGMGPQRLARETGMTVPEAKKFIDAYFERLPKVRAFLDETLAKAESLGYAETLAGRRRQIPELQSNEPRVRANAENMAVNTPVQGSAADIIKEAMIELDRALLINKIRGGMILQVHDELVLEVHEDDAEPASALMRECMEKAHPLSVPLKVDLAKGHNWLLAHG